MICDNRFQSYPPLPAFCTLSAQLGTVLLSSYSHSIPMYCKIQRHYSTLIESRRFCISMQIYTKVTWSCLTLCNPIDCIVNGILQARILEWVAFPFSRGIFPTQGSNPGLPHCWQILYQFSHKGNPRILEWVVYPFSSRSSQPRNRPGISCIAGRFFTN